MWKAKKEKPSGNTGAATNVQPMKTQYWRKAFMTARLRIRVYLNWGTVLCLYREETMAIVSRDLATYHVGALMLVFITICLSLCPTVCHAGYLAVNFFLFLQTFFFQSLSFKMTVQPGYRACACLILDIKTGLGQRVGVCRVVLVPRAGSQHP